MGQNEFEIENGVLKAYRGPGGKVAVPEGVTAIGDAAFKNCCTVTAVSIPEGVTSIGKDAFYLCTWLASITVPASVTSIGPDAFYGCRNLAHIAVSPDNPAFKSEDDVIYTKDGRTLVAVARKFYTFAVPEEVETIEPLAFSGCQALTEITLPEGLRHIGDMAFSHCRELRKITIPGTVERIGDKAFYACEHLAEVTLAPGVRELGEEVFMDCRQLASVSLPDSLTALGRGAFYDCHRLLRIEIPQRITRIRTRTFCNCAALSCVSLPDAVTDIEGEAFYFCCGLKHIELPPRVTQIRRSTFGHCRSLETISLPAGLQRIEEGAFTGCRALREVVLPEGLLSIGKNAFDGCEGLTDVKIPDSVEKVGDFAFSDCTGLVRAAFSDGTEIVDAFGLENSNVFSGCTALREYVASPRSRRYRTVDGVLLSRDGRQLLSYPPGRRCDRYDIPETVEKVFAWAFSHASARVVYVPESVQDFSRAAAEGEEEPDPFVASARVDLMPFLGKPIFLGPVESLPPRHQRRVVEGFLVALDIGMPEAEPWKESYIDYVRQQYSTYEHKAWKNELLLRFLMEQGMLRPETAQLMRRKYVAAAWVDLVAWLSDYLKRTGTPEG